MSLVGTRPPTVDEWDKYELHHRARLATKPGLTGMWQVSGRSNITDFEEVVALRHMDQYVEEDENFGDFAPYDVSPAYVIRTKNQNDLMQSTSGGFSTPLACSTLYFYAKVAWFYRKKITVSKLVFYLRKKAKLAVKRGFN